MKKKIFCIIDFGQTHLKFILVTESFRVARILREKNNFIISEKSIYLYDVDKILLHISRKILKIRKRFNIKYISFIGHGSCCFYMKNNKKLKSGYHFSSADNNKKINDKYKKKIIKLKHTYTENYQNFHNLGKNYFYLLNTFQNFKFMTLTSFFAYVFSGKNISDQSYLACHSYLWNFKKNSFSKLILKNKNFTLPNIKKSGSLIGKFKVNKTLFNKTKILYKKLFNKCSIYTGAHDTSAAFYFHRQFFFEKNAIFLSTGTSVVIGKFISNLNNKTKEYNANLLRSPDEKGFFYSKSLNGTEFLKNIKKKNSKNFVINFINEIKLSKLHEILLIVDGPLCKDTQTMNILKKNPKLNKIYLSKNQNAPSLGIARLIFNKNKLIKNDFYSQIK